MTVGQALDVTGYGPSTEIAGGPGPLAAHPRLVLLAADLAGVALVAAAAGGQNPDVLFHVLWIILCVETFLFGGLVGATRILVAGLAVVWYAALAEGGVAPLGTEMMRLDLEEWPLMLVIVSIVAILAERASRARARYAALYQTTRDRLVTAQEDERRLLAADLHDGVGQTLTALNLTLDAVGHRIEHEPGAVDAVRVPVARATQLGEVALEEVRRVAFRLRPPRLEEVGLVASVAHLAALSGPQITVSAPAGLARPGILAPHEEAEVFRIVQEAIANAMRHARAERVDVTLVTVHNRLEVEIVDNGMGFTVGVGRRRGLGMETMYERAHAIGGSVIVTSRRHRGTRVRLRVPLPDAGARAVAAPVEAVDSAGAAAR